MRRLSLLVSALAVAGLAEVGIANPQDPPVDLVWRPASARLPEGITRVDWHGRRAVRFDAGDPHAWDLSEDWGVAVDIVGPLTILWELELTEAPAEKAPIVSKWKLSNGGRSYELGIRSDRRLFFSISASGRWDEAAAELTSTRRLEVGVPVIVAAVFEPGVEMRLWVNGEPSGRLAIGVPPSVHSSETPLWLGSRPPGELPLDVILGPGRLSPRAWSEGEIGRWARQRGYSNAPPETPTFDQRLQAAPLDVPIERLTDGPAVHWFGYYDKEQMDPTGRWALALESDFENRSPTPNDIVRVGLTDLRDRSWRTIGESRAWCWQQGAMLQWRPGHPRQVIWNDREGGRFVMRWHDLDSGETKTISRPVYHASPDGRFILSTDFRRIQDMRPGYGYAGVPDPNREVLAPVDEGIWRVDLETGEERLLLSMAGIARHPYPDADPATDKHYVNHVQWSPSGERFFFLDRWRGSRFQGFRTRAFTAAADGTDLRLISDRPGLSHFVWIDDTSLLIWRDGAYRVYPDDGRKTEVDSLVAPNGHVSLLGEAWAVTDTYPRGRRREQSLLLWHRPSGDVRLLAQLTSPSKYRGEWRCDLHPRVGPSGREILVDSTHEGLGRQVYLIRFSELPAPKVTR